MFKSAIKRCNKLLFLIFLGSLIPASAKSGESFKSVIIPTVGNHEESESIEEIDCFEEIDDSEGIIMSEDVAAPESLDDSEDIFIIIDNISLIPGYYVKSNLIPWAATIANIKGEISFGHKWSIDLGLWYCPWIVSQKHSLKTLCILPEGRWWLKDNRYGHFLNFHLTASWFNLRFGDYRYQDTNRPAFGAGIGYGYKLMFNDNWGMEFTIGAGFLSLKYDRYYNILNGAKIDTRITSYWGIDRLAVSFVYKFDN